MDGWIDGTMLINKFGTRERERESEREREREGERERERNGEKERLFASCREHLVDGHDAQGRRPLPRLSLCRRAGPLPPPLSRHPLPYPATPSSAPMSSLRTHQSSTHQVRKPACGSSPLADNCAGEGKSPVRDWKRGVVSGADSCAVSWLVPSHAAVSRFVALATPSHETEA